MHHLVRTAGAALALSSATVAQAQDSAHVWRGRYVCNQGVTGVDLVLEPATATTLKGYFLFYPTLENPAVPRGCFRVSGTIDASGHTALKGGQWVSQPGNYATIDLDGVMTADGVWTGRIDGPNCGVFEFRRVPSTPPSCENSYPAQ